MSNLAYKYDEYYTKEDYNQWEGDWELIEGMPYAMAPSPMYGHQFVNGKIYRLLDELLDDCPHCSAVIETDVEFCDDTIVRPDSFVICYEPKERLDKAPKIVFEVVSKNSIKRDEKIKFELYQNEAVEYYILVYPDNQKAKIYQLKEHKYVKIGDFSSETYKFDIGKCNIEFDFDFIWRKNK
jgi:Uma2 family endonuclease